MKKLSSLVILLCLCCCRQEQVQVFVTENVPTLFASSVLMVIAPRDFRDEEFKTPYDLFTKSGAKVIVASTGTLPAKGMLGMVVKPDISIDQVIPDSFDALVIVGGTGCQILWDNATLHRIVQNFNDAQKTVAAICLAPIILGRAGILKDKEVAVYSIAKDDIEKCGAVCTGSDVETCGNIITGSGPKAAKDFACEVLNALKQ